MSNTFHFKQFSIAQDRCAMKVGTDGVLLGALADVDLTSNSILDVGAGTGLVALMLAQRYAAETIDALEINEAAFEQCVENFEASPWADRLFCYHTDFERFFMEWDEPYDAVVCNPPFYTEQVTSGNNARDIARQNSALPFDLLLKGVLNLLSKDGVFTVIIPFKEEEKFIALATDYKLHLQKTIRIRGNPSAEIKRSVLKLTFQPAEIQTAELVIELERHKYTPAFKAITKDFYLDKPQVR